MFSHPKETRKNLDTWSYGLLLAFAALVPIAAYTGAAVPPAMTKIWFGGVLIIATLIAYIAAVLKRQELSIPRMLLIPAVWLLPLIYLVSMLFAPGGTMTLYGERLAMDSTSFMLLGAVLLTLTTVLLTTPKRALGVYLAMLVSAATLTILQLVLFLGRDMVTSWGVIMPSLSLLGSLNDLAVFFGLIVVFVLMSLVLLPATVIVRAILALVLAAAAFFLAVVNLTVLWWILGLFALGCLIYSVTGGLFSRNNDTRRSVSVASLVIVALSAFFVFGSASLTGALPERLGVGELDVRPSWSTTVSLGREALDGAALLGTGPGSFVYIWAAHMPSDINSTVFWQADFAYGIGLVPTTIISTGLLGALVWLVFFGLFLYYGFRSFAELRRVLPGDVTQYIRVTSFVGALYLWIISLIQVPSPALVFYAFLLTGVFIASRAFGDDAHPRLHLVFHDSPRAGFLVTLLLTLAVLGSLSGVYSLTTRFMAEAAFQKGFAILGRGGDLDTGEAYVTSAIARHPVDAYYRLLSNVDIVRIRALLATERAPEEIRDQFRSLLARSIQNAREATELDKRDYQNWANLGTLYQAVTPLGIDGASESANAAFDTALEQRPSSPQFYLAKAALARADGDSEEARRLVEQAVALRSRYTDAIFLLAQLQLEEESVEAAIGSVEAITIFEPGNPVAFFQLGLLEYGAEDYVASAQALERAVALNPVYANARYFLGLAYWRLGNSARALDQFERVAETNPNNEEVRTIIENLSAGNDPFANLDTGDDIASLDRLPIDETLPEAGPGAIQEPPTDLSE